MYYKALLETNLLASNVVNRHKMGWNCFSRILGYICAIQPKPIVNQDVLK